MLTNKDNTKLTLLLEKSQLKNLSSLKEKTKNSVLIQTKLPRKKKIRKLL